MEKTTEARLKTIRGIVLDVDGVLTDGSLLLLPDGEQVRSMNIKDGFAIQYCLKAGYPMTVISAGSVSKGVDDRLRRLGFHDFRLGVSDKSEAFEDFVFSYGLTYETILYIGDDMPDYECMLKAGFAACPADAAAEIKTISHYVASAGGGQGCVREVLEHLLMVQHKHWSLTL